MRLEPTVIVPMKGHSARVPRKNMRPLCGRPLFYWIVKAAQGANSVGEVVIETDSDEIERTANKQFPGIRVLRRPERLYGDDTPMNALIEFHLTQLDGEAFLQTHSTNPLLTSETIERAIKRFREAADAGAHDSLFSVTPMRTRFYWADGRPVNHDPEELIKTQDLPPLMEENSNIYLFTRDSFGQNKRRIGARPIMFEMDPLEAVDIDEASDFVLAEALMRARLDKEAG